MARTFRIRAATVADAGALAALCDQLGYPVDALTIMRRLDEIAAHGAGVVLVAESADAGVVGWGHVMSQHHLVHDARAELTGLVVDEAKRGAGVGKALLRAAEAWAGAHGCAELVVRSNVIRERAHRFYLRENYIEKKRQKVFVKKISSRSLG